MNLFFSVEDLVFLECSYTFQQRNFVILVTQSWEKMARDIYLMNNKS